MLKLLRRLVRGGSLNKPFIELCPPGTVYAPSMQKHEKQVLDIATQLLRVRFGQWPNHAAVQGLHSSCGSAMQTVHLLHTVSNIAHLDITSSNIML